MAGESPSRRPATLLAAVAGLVATAAVACLVYMGPMTQTAAPAELLVRYLGSECECDVPERRRRL